MGGVKSFDPFGYRGPPKDAKKLIPKSNVNAKKKKQPRIYITLKPNGGPLKNKSDLRNQYDHSRGNNEWIKAKMPRIIDP